MYTLIGIIWFVISIIIATKLYNKSEKNVIRLGSPIKRLLFSIWDWILYLLISLVAVALVMAVLLGILFVWGWIIGLVALAGVVVWVLLRRKR